MQPNTEEPKGVIGRSYRDSLPVVWKFINEPPSAQSQAALPWLAVISWDYDGSENNGMPPKEINELMINLESAIESNLVADGQVQHAISKTGSNLKELIYYIRDKDNFMERFNAVLRTRELYPIEINFYHDPEWREQSNTRSLFRPAGNPTS
jgi:hypothetical protein